MAQSRKSIENWRKHGQRKIQYFRIPVNAPELFKNVEWRPPLSADAIRLNAYRDELKKSLKVLEAVYRVLLNSELQWKSKGPKPYPYAAELKATRDAVDRITTLLR